ncbi:MAG: aminotransferase class I/II-fold pyridoxal phosphate-dependent enzyme [Marinilabiliales bacterium]|nr:aminotransferase class I/II-fold pyridoxal phosphate-dependent enzyme [Marinilabiliales bacterium]
MPHRSRSAPRPCPRRPSGGWRRSPWRRARPAKTVHPLNIGQPDIPTPQAILDRLRGYPRALRRLRSVAGPARVRRGAARATTPASASRSTTEEIFVTTAGSEAILFALDARVRPRRRGHRLRALLHQLQRLRRDGAACEIVPVTTRGRGRLPPARPRRDRGEDRPAHARHPHLLAQQPDRHRLHRRTRSTLLAAICRERGLFLIADEVYQRVRLRRPKAPLGAARSPGCEDQVVVVDSVSKRYSPCGARIGAIIVSRNRGGHGRRSLRFGQARLCPPTLEQFGAASALTELPPRLLRRASSPSTRSAATWSMPALTAIAGRSFVRKPRGRVLHHAPSCRSTTPTTFAALAAQRLRARRRDGDGRARPTASTPRPG